MQIDGITVVLLTEVEDKETKIIIATPKVYLSAITANLEREKFLTNVSVVRHAFIHG